MILLLICNSKRFLELIIQFKRQSFKAILLALLDQKSLWGFVITLHPLCCHHHHHHLCPLTFYISIFFSYSYYSPFNYYPSVHDVIKGNLNIVHTDNHWKDHLLWTSSSHNHNILTGTTILENKSDAFVLKKTKDHELREKR